MYPVPGPWEAAILALAALRLWRLAAEDTIIEKQRDRLLLAHPKLDDLISCPWCLGFWICGVEYTAWWWWPDLTLAAAFVFALSAAVGIIGHFLSS